MRARRDASTFPFRYLRLSLLVVIASLTLRLEGAPAVQSQDVISGIDGSQAYREQKLDGYTAVEHYAVHNSHFRETAELMADVRYQRESGKQYRVLWRKGPGFLQRRVIDRILKEDAALSRPAERPHTLLTSANYVMKVQGTQFLHGKLCYVVKLHPRAPRFSLIEGTAWVEVKDYSLLRIEGRPAASPSFWIGRPWIEREYTSLDGLSFPQHSRATFDGLFPGKSKLDVDYSQYALSEHLGAKADALSRSDSDLTSSLTDARHSLGLQGPRKTYSLPPPRIGQIIVRWGHRFDNSLEVTEALTGGRSGGRFCSYSCRTELPRR
jgi:hypothetical protein